MTSPAVEAAFEAWLTMNPPGTCNVHTAFLAGWKARGRIEEERLGGASRTVDRDELPDPERPGA